MGWRAAEGRSGRMVTIQWWIAGVVFLLAALTPVRSVVPGLAVLWSPLGWAVVAGAVVAILPGRRLALVFLARLPWWAVLGTVVAAALPAGLGYVERALATGDEPHYLIMARSLWQDGDLDVTDNMRRRDYQDFSYGFQFHYGRPARDGQPYPAHSPGLPLLLAPILALGGRPACVAFLACLLGLLAVAVQRLARKCGADREGALLAWVVAVGPPTFLFSLQIYTELPSALAVAAALNLLLAERAGPWRAVLAALLVACLPWLHLKLVLAALALGVVGVVRLDSRPRWLFMTTAGLMACVFLAYHWRVFGSPLAAGYGGFPPRGYRHASPLASLAGLWLDREFGLLACAPVFLLALPGSFLAVTAFCRRCWPLVTTALAILLPILPWRMWWAGQSSPARFLVPLLPILAVTIGLHRRDLRKGLVRWALPLLLVGFASTAFMVLAPQGPSVVGTRGDGTSVAEALGPGRFLPSLVPGAEHEEWRIAATWTAGLMLLLALHAWARRAAVADRLFMAPLLPLAVWLAGAAAVELWARG